MNLDKILELEKEALTSSNTLGMDDFQFSIFALVATIVLCIIAASIIVEIDNMKGFSAKKALNLKSVVALIAVLTSLILITKSFILNPNDVGKEYLKWKEEVAYPYIESLETEKYKIKDLSLGETIKDTSELDFSMYTDSTLSDSIVDVSYMNDEEETIKLKAKMKVIFDLKEGEESYIQFKNLDEDLGQQLKKGIYNAEIHLQKVNVN